MTRGGRPVAPHAAAFRRDGYVAPLPAIGGAEAAALLGELEAVEARKGGRLPPALNAKPHLLLPSLWALVRDARIVEPVAAILGDDILCLGSSFIAKHPGDRRHVSWHQDATHWHLSSPEAVTAWIALTPSDATNGCVRMVPGTHARQQDHDHPEDPLNILGLKERIRRPIDEAAARDVVLAPGEMSLHHPLVVHGSAPNGGTTRRVGFAVRYIPAHVQHADGVRTSATPVRGRGSDAFAMEAAPEGPFARPAMMRHAAVLRMLRGAID